MTTVPDGAYCSSDQLLIGDVDLAVGEDLNTWISAAADEMNAKLGFIYVVPVVGVGSGPLAPHELAILRSINLKLASGRFICAHDQAGEHGLVNAYGASLIREAMGDLMAIANGDVVLQTALRANLEEAMNGPNRTPGVINEDTDSLREGFERVVHRGEGGVLVRPGDTPDLPQQWPPWDAIYYRYFGDPD